MNSVLLAGATGYLGSHILDELKRRQYFVRAIDRHSTGSGELGSKADEVFRAELTRPETLAGCCRDIDVVISTVGITRQKDGLTYMDVDYQANLNLLQEAVRSGVKRFIYIFIFNAEKIGELKIIQAKQKFADALKVSGLDYCLVKPTGFFSDMGDFLKMAKKGTVYLFGKGDHRMNPIDGRDLAEVCVNVIGSGDKEINVGGPEIFTHRQIAETAFRVLNKPARISYIPDWVRKLLLWVLRAFTPSRVYGPVEFVMTVLAMDMVAPPAGSRTLESYFSESNRFP